MGSEAVHRDLALASPLVTGPDVKALQHAANREAKDRELGFHLAEDGELGPHTVGRVRLVAYAIGLARSTVKRVGNGHIDEKTQRLVRVPRRRTKVERARAKVRAPILRRRRAASDSVRSKIVAYCSWGVANEPSIHYRQSRPYPSSPRSLPMYTDCSGFATLAYKDAGGPDPNGSNFNGYGYTGTILAHCRHIPKADAKEADLVVFGSGTGTHVVVLVEPGSKADPLCVSHGQEAGPIRVPVSVEARAHPGQPVTYCEVL